MEKVEQRVVAGARRPNALPRSAPAPGQCPPSAAMTRLSSIPSVKTGTEPKEPKPNGSISDSDFLGTEIVLEPKNRTDRFG
jgi:hypothetical protein